MNSTIQGVSIGLDAVSPGSEFVVNVGDIQASIIIKKSETVRSALQRMGETINTLAGTPSSATITAGVREDGRLQVQSRHRGWGLDASATYDGKDVPCSPI